MRKISLIFLLYLFNNNSYGQNIELALRRNPSDTYSGKPIRIIEKTFIDMKSKEFFYKKISGFDSLGRLLFIENYDPEGELTDKLTYTYSTIANRIIKKVIEEWTIKSYSKKSYLYAYDSTGFLTKIAENDGKDHRKKILKITNNKNGDPVDIVVCDENGIPYATESAVYYYNKNAVVTKVASNKGWLLNTDTSRINLNKPNELIAEKYITNEKNEPITIEVKNSNKSVIRLNIKHKYDPTGNCISEKWQKFDFRQLSYATYQLIERDIQYSIK